MKKVLIRDLIIRTLAISMLIVVWVFCLDALFYGLWHTFIIVLSIMLFALAVALLQQGAQLLLERWPILCILIEYSIIVIMFVGFTQLFQWVEEIKLWQIVLYTIPIYVVAYLLRLTGVKRDADFINKKISARKQRQQGK